MGFTSKELADKIAGIMDQRKAKEIEIINIGDNTTIADYFVICSGTSSTHIKGISDEIEFILKGEGRQFARIEGYDSAKWILMDYQDVVVHIFLEEDRSYYNIERLWKSTNTPH